MNESLNLVHLKCLLRSDEQMRLEELTRIQQVQAHASTELPPALREGMTRREHQLIREVNHLKRLLNTTTDTTIVTLVSGGDA